MNYRINVRAIITLDNKILLVRSKKSPEYWCLPGGGLNTGEELKVGLQRELLEELGVKAEIGDLLYIQQVGKNDNFNFPEFLFHVTNGADFKDIDMTKTTHGNLELVEAKFVDPNEVFVLPEFIKTEWKNLVEANFKSQIKYYTEAISEQSKMDL
jgi:ADP-ribose pyrophosphatase YjhB (NUDIX family)